MWGPGPRLCPLCDKDSGDRETAWPQAQGSLQGERMVSLKSLKEGTEALVLGVSGPEGGRLQLWQLEHTTRAVPEASKAVPGA